MKLRMQAVPFAPTPENAVRGETVGKWIVSVDGSPFCYAYLYTSPDHDDLDCWWITSLEGGLKDNPVFLDNDRRVSNVTLRKGTRLTDWVISQYWLRILNASVAGGGG